MNSYIPQDDAARKAAPMFRGLLGYFPAALFEVAAHSLDSDLKHGAPPEDAPHWMRGASTDHEDTIIRHLIDAGPRRTKVPGMFKGAEWSAPKGSSAKDARRYHLRCIAWRALALLQEDCEADGAAPGVSSVFPEAVDKLKATLESMQALHPAQKLAIEAFKADPFSDRFAVDDGPEPAQLHPGDEGIDRFAALRGSEQPPRRVFRVYHKPTGERSQNYPGDYETSEVAEQIIGKNLIGMHYEMHCAAYEIREEDE